MIRGQTLAIAAALSVSVAGCCCNLPDFSALLVPVEEEPSDSTPGVDLGLAAHPPTTPESSATKFAWRDRRLDPSVYRARYALGASEQASVDQAHRELARRVKFKDQGGGVFKWTPPAGCDVRMQCVYEDLASESRDDLDPLIARFRSRVNEANLTPVQTVELLMSFVQSIPYEIPKDRPFGLLPPALVAAQKKGDCDSKSLLLHVMLDSFGIDSVLLTSDAHRHSMLGVNIPSTGQKIIHEGRAYAFVETTAKTAPIGWISKDLLKPNDWVVVPVSVRGGGSTKTNGSSNVVTGKVK